MEDPSSARTIPLTVFFLSGLTMYNNFAYYSEPQGIYRADADGETEQLHRTVGVRATGINVVHPSRQPSGSQRESHVSYVGPIEECVHRNSSCMEM